jgi:molybdopterin converting factor subunit 1
MHVRVVLFAQLRDLAGAASMTCDVADAATARDVWRALVAGHPALAPFESSVSCAVNAEYARLHTTVRAGDEVAFLPPVSGG